MTLADYNGHQACDMHLPVGLCQIACRTTNDLPFRTLRKDQRSRCVEVCMARQSPSRCLVLVLLHQDFILCWRAHARCMQFTQRISLQFVASLSAFCPSLFLPGTHRAQATPPQPLPNASADLSHELMCIHMFTKLPVSFDSRVRSPICTAIPHAGHEVCWCCFFFFHQILKIENERCPWVTNMSCMGSYLIGSPAT